MTKGKTHKSNKSQATEPNAPALATNTPAALAADTSAAFVLPKWLPLTLILVVTFLLRLQYLDMPLERDESIYAYIGKLALNGGKPYVDFFEMKPPVMFYSYALLVGLFGYSATGVHLAAAVVAVLNTLFTFLIGRKLGGLSVACLSATAYALWSLSPGVYGAYLMSENVALSWGLPALLLALNYPNTTNSKQLFAVGVLLSMAFMVKQTTGALAAAVAVYWLTHWFSNRKETPFFSFFKPVGWTISGFFVPILLIALGLWAIGSWQDTTFWLIDYPRLYASEISEATATAAFGLMRRLVFTDYQGYFVLAALGILVTIVARRSLAEKLMLITWAILGVLTVGMGQRFYGHYWLLALPVLSIFGALFFREIGTWLRQKRGKLEASIALMLGVVWSVHAFFVQPTYYVNPPLTEISRNFSPGNPYVEDQVFSNYIQKLIKPTDRIAVFGSEPQYFIYLNKISPIRHVYFPLIANGQFPNATIWQDETIEAFKKTQPEYVIWNKYSIAWMFKPNYSQRLYTELYDYMMEHYDLVAFVENPGSNQRVEIKEPTNGGRIPAAPTYISVLRRRF
jgi:Dolichyl-phosphate-mannose-protein mannosyltransferase